MFFFENSSLIQVPGITSRNLWKTWAIILKGIILINKRLYTIVLSVKNWKSVFVFHHYYHSISRKCKKHTKLVLDKKFWKIKYLNLATTRTNFFPHECSSYRVYWRTNQIKSLWMCPGSWNPTNKITFAAFHQDHYPTIPPNNSTLLSRHKICLSCNCTKKLLILLYSSFWERPEMVEKSGYLTVYGNPCDSVNIFYHKKTLQNFS